MSSQKRIEANRRNAQRSTGPRTPEGKARSAQNSTVHGFSSFNGNPLHPACFLQMEDQARFQEVLDTYIVTYSPQHPDEFDLLTEAVYAKWRQQRLWIAETNQVEIAIALNEGDLRRTLPAANHQAHLANGIAKSADMLKLYLRYDAQLHRHYLRCIKALRDLQASRPPVDDAPEPEPQTPEPQTPEKPAPTAPNEATPSEPTPKVPAPNEPKPLDPTVQDAAPPNEATQNEETKDKATPNEPEITPEQARIAHMKAEIQRFIEANRAFLDRQREYTF